MIALYDLSKYLASFNFFEWLVQVKAMGAKSVAFDIRHPKVNKWPQEKVLQRFHSILVPGCALADLDYRIYSAHLQGPPQALDFVEPGGKQLVRFWNKYKRIPRLHSVKPTGAARYTVTLRKTQRSPLRDSDEKAWRDFASEIGAQVIPDYDTEPMHLHDRVALYAGAEMNFFVSNGPGILCSLTEYPCMLFNTVHAAGSLAADGIGYGKQYPWMLPNQRAIWEIATPESLRRHFYQWREKSEFALDLVPTKT